MSLVVVVNCGAGNVLLGFEISMFYFFYKTLFYTHMKAEKICYKMVITNQVCSGGALNTLNKALLGGLPLA